MNRPGPCPTSPPSGGSGPGAMGADSARGGSHGRKGLQRPAPPADWTDPAHRVSDLRGSFPRSEAAPIVDARWWPIRAPSCPGGSSRWIIESRPPGLALSPCATLRGAERARPAPWGPLVSEGPTSEVDGPWPHSRFPVLGRANGTDPAPPTIPDDRSAQRPTRVPGATPRAKRAAGPQSQ